MRLCAAIAVGVLATFASVTSLAEALAFGRAVSDNFHGAYVIHFFDNATFLVNCL